MMDLEVLILGGRRSNVCMLDVPLLRPRYPLSHKVLIQNALRLFWILSV